jgi:YHS domain-containing protein
MRRLTGGVLLGMRPAAAQTKARDPVCGMLVDPCAAAQGSHGGHSYFFCSPECRSRFEDHPDQYLARRNLI